MIKNNNYLDSLPKSLIDDVRSVMENKCKKGCGCDKCSCDKEEKDEKEEKNEKEMKEAYSKDAVDKAIASSNRSGRKIGGREAKKIHALLKGSTGYKPKWTKDEADARVAKIKADNKGVKEEVELEETKMVYKKVLGQHTVHIGDKFHRSFPTEGDAVKYISSNEKKKDVKEEAEQIDEISKDLALATFHGLQDRARKRFDRGIPSNKKGVMLAKAKIEGDAKVPATRCEETEINEEVDFAKVRKQFDRNEDRNEHSKNVVLIAKHAGTPEHHKEAMSIYKQHNKLGYLSGDLMKRREALYKQLEKTDNYKKIFPEHKIKEDVDLEEAKKESPIAGTRLISKHQGKDGHHAEVRHNPDWNEYQVHHYENGKHMGGGPVSYHDSKEDAKETAEYEVKHYRPKGGSLHKEEAEQVEVVDNEFNRTNYKHLIGKKYPKSKAPSYARVKEVTKTANEETEIDEAKKMKGEDPCWKNYKMVGTKKGKGGKEVPNCVPEETEVNEKLIGKQHKLDKNKNGKLDSQDFKMLRKEEASLEEKLNPSMGAAKYIQDFVKSKDPRFEGKTKKERIKMALGAYYGAKNESVETEDTDTIDEAYGDKKDYKKHHIYVNGRYVATTTWAENPKQAKRKFLDAHPEFKNKRIGVEKDG